MYKELLEKEYKDYLDISSIGASMSEYLASDIFNFTTYDAGVDELFVRKAVEVMWAIENRSTFEYQNGEENYQWYLVMCNMPFFVNRLEWGTSIRGAWWSGNFTVAGLNKTFTKEEWSIFIRNLAELVAPDLLVQQ